MGDQSPLFDIGDPVALPEVPAPVRRHGGRPPRPLVEPVVPMPWAPEVKLMPVQPFLKWAGGKRRLAAKLASLMPRKFGRYFEPFLGGGALFFHARPRNAWLSDTNAELINAYKALQADPEMVIQYLSEHAYERGYYRRVSRGDLANLDELSESQRAARLIYLQFTCFNGLYRVNKKGVHNTPFGKFKDPKFCDPVRLRACHAALNPGAQLLHRDFTYVERHAERGDFVYFDSPYVPASKTADFVSYTADGFDERRHRELADLFRTLSSEGVFCMASNSDAPLVRELYDGFRMLEVTRAGTISSKGSERGEVAELIICGWLCRCGGDGCRGVDDDRHLCGGPKDACKIGGCSKCGGAADE